MYAIRSYYAPAALVRLGKRTGARWMLYGGLDARGRLAMQLIDLKSGECVITSYSIHYTKLYDNTQLRSQLAEITRLSTHDSLTEIYNRRKFASVFADELGKSGQGRRP